MSWAPGWESIQATGWWSGFFFWASIVSLIGLGISEVASHRFSERKDELVERQQIAEKERHDIDIARVQHDAALAIERAAGLEKEAETARASIAEANARAAKAEKETAELQNESQKLRMGRALFFSSSKCREALRGRPTGKVEILWQRGVGDASFLAFVLGDCLRGDEGVAWWKGDNPKQVDDVPEGAMPTGITVIGKTGGLFVFRRPSDALMDLIGSALSAGSDQTFGSISAGTDRTLPDDTVRIFIGPIQ